MDMNKGGLQPNNILLYSSTCIHYANNNNIIETKTGKSVERCISPCC